MIDADTFDESRARIIRDAVKERLGALPIRVGRYPKAGYLVRVSAAFQYSRIEFGGGEKEKAERVEILSDNRFFVAAGVHPGTRKPYRWPAGDPPRLADVPIVEPEALTDLLEALRPLLPAAGEVKREGSAAVVDQSFLLAWEPGRVREAVAAIPNTTAAFPSRESWRDVGYAIKAAMGPEREAEALELFHEWSDRWEDPPIDDTGVAWGNKPDYVDAEWARMKPPFRLGFFRLVSLAKTHSNGAYTLADAYWEEPRQPNPEASTAFEPVDIFGHADPVELGTPPAGSLPLVFETWARSEARRKGAPEAFAAVSAIAAAAAAVGASLRIRPRQHDTGWEEPGAL